MDWTDIACIVFVCTTANHLGLTGAVIALFSKKRETLPVVSCPKCLTFWCVLAYGLQAGAPGVARLLAISFLAAYMAVWLELAEGIIDRLYEHIYEQIYTTADTADDDAPGA